MLISEERILTTHVGSLIRPEALISRIRAAQQEKASAQALTQLRHDAIVDAVRAQRAVGIDIVNDGEFSKESWAAYVLARIEGFESRPDQPRPLYWLGRDRERFAAFIAQEMPRAASGAPTDACVGPIRYRDPRLIESAAQDLASICRDQNVPEAFMTAVAPASAAYNGVNEYYSSERDYIFALAEALRTEYLAIHRAGLLVQVDDALLANMYDHLVQQSPARYREWAQLRVDALNHALRDIPENRIRYHICFGSWHVPHLSDAPLEDIIDLVLQVRAGAYSIEAANPRHEHEWRVWEKVRLPAGRVLLPGVVTHHLVTVEHPQLVADRLVRFARLVGRERVIASTDCGFSQNDTVQRVHPTIMWAKFEALVAGARLATRELWGRAP